MATALELNMATGLRTDLEANRNRSLLGGAQSKQNSTNNRRIILC